jgi:hypothetical protein
MIVSGHSGGAKAASSARSRRVSSEPQGNVAVTVSPPLIAAGNLTTFRSPPSFERGAERVARRTLGHKRPHDSISSVRHEKMGVPNATSMFSAAGDPDCAIACVRNRMDRVGPFDVDRLAQVDHFIDSLPKFTNLGSLGILDVEILPSKCNGFSSATVERTALRVRGG